MSIRMKSAYLPYDSADGTRYLVETLWPEGVDTCGLLPYLWVREMAPSYYIKETALWKLWSPEKFREQYKQELQEPLRRVWFDRILKEAQSGKVTLLHRSHEKESKILPKDTAVYYLKQFFDEELNKRAESLSPKSSPETRSSFQNSLSQDVERWGNEGGWQFYGQ